MKEKTLSIKLKLPKHIAQLVQDLYKAVKEVDIEEIEGRRDNVYGEELDKFTKQIMHDLSVNVQIEEVKEE